MATAIIEIEDKPEGGLKVNINFDPAKLAASGIAETPAQNAAMVMLRLFQAQVAGLGIPQREKIK